MYWLSTDLDSDSYINVILLTAKSWSGNIHNDADCINIGSRSIYCQAAGI